MIYICIPSLNEARTVGVLLWKIRRVLAEFPRDYHLLVLDDGSTDETSEVLAPYAKVLPLTVLRNERTAGYAAALERLFREVATRSTHPRRDVAVVMQADFTESPDDLPALVKRIEGGADVVATHVAGAEPAPELPRPLRWGRKLLPWLVRRSALPKEVRDPLSGFRAYRVQVLRRALAARNGKPLLERGGWAANAELLLAVLPHARRTEDAPVSLRYDRRDRETRFRAWSTAGELWELRRVTPRRLPELPPPPAPKPGGGGRPKKQTKNESQSQDTPHVP